jgi:hypothetical protein
MSNFVVFLGLLVIAYPDGASPDNLEIASYMLVGCVVIDCVRFVSWANSKPTRRTP